MDEIVKAQAKPWYGRYGLTVEDLHGLRCTENWHFRYGGDRASGGSAKGVEGEVY